VRCTLRADGAGALRAARGAGRLSAGACGVGRPLSGGTTAAPAGVRARGPRGLDRGRVVRGALSAGGRFGAGVRDAGRRAGLGGGAGALADCGRIRR
jgi:hypothetical protein